MTVQVARGGVSAAEALHTSSKSRGIYAKGAKRLLDLALVVAALPFLVPFFLIVSALIALDGHSPFFRQERIGMNGKRFSMWKFRTMIPDADKALERHLAGNPAARAEWDSKQKLVEDPRITGIGRILRRTSMDELPQLINVLTGEMSLVGPRPMMVSQQALYPGHAYYRLRPGMTGSWQVSERHASTFAERATYDDAYEANLSFATDVRILARTVGVVVRCTGV